MKHWWEFSMLPQYNEKLNAYLTLYLHWTMTCTEVAWLSLPYLAIFGASRTLLSSFSLVYKDKWTIAACIWCSNSDVSVTRTDLWPEHYDLKVLSVLHAKIRRLNYPLPPFPACTLQFLSETWHYCSILYQVWLFFITFLVFFNSNSLSSTNRDQNVLK